MAKWFKEFPINLKNAGADKTRGKLGMVASIGTKAVKCQSGKNPSADNNGVGSLLSGARNGKNSAIDHEGRTERNGDAKVWDSLLPGKSRKNSKAECVTEGQQQRTPKSSSSANAYISRLIRVDKQDKSPNFNITNQVVPEKPQAQYKTETVSAHNQLYLIIIMGLSAQLKTSNCIFMAYSHSHHYSLLSDIMLISCVLICTA